MNKKKKTGSDFGFVNANHCEHGCYRRAIFSEFANAAFCSPLTFPQEMLEILLAKFPLKAASFYSCAPTRKSIILRAQKGLETTCYESYELPLDTLAGRAISTKKVVIEKDVALTPYGYRDKELISKYALKSMAAIPIGSNIQMIEKTYFQDLPPLFGVLCIYPNEDSELVIISEYLMEISDFIGQMLVLSLEVQKMMLRAQVVEKSLASKDLNSCLHRIIHFLTNKLSIEASSIFLYDEGVKLLRARATTGFANSLHKADANYRSNDNSITWSVYETGKMYISSNISTREKSGRFVEKVSGKRKSFMVLPVRHNIIDSTNASKILGAIRFLNKTTKFEGRVEIVPFSWEDQALLEFCCNMMAVISHQLQARERRVEYFEKIMHGTASNIQATLQNMHMLERRGNLSKYLPDNLQYAVPDSITFLSDIKGQIDRLSEPVPAELALSPVLLGGEILAKIVPYIERLANASEIRHIDITNLRESGYFTLPAVKANADALMTVFRNLGENAIKYNNKNKNECIIEISCESVGDIIKVYFTDEGIGIPIEEADWIFEEGYRAENAMRRNPAGTGYGLSQS